MLQGVGTNTLAKTSTTKRSPKVDEITGVATINDGTSTIFIENYNNLKGGLRISTQKAFRRMYYTVNTAEFL